MNDDSMRINSLLYSEALRGATDVLEKDGVLIVRQCFAEDEIARLRRELDRCSSRFGHLVPTFLRERAGEIGAIRALPALSTTFLEVSTDRRILDLVDENLNNSSILHLFNGFITPSLDGDSELPSQGSAVFQNRFHRDFPRFVSEKLLSINFFIPLSDFSAENGATEFLVGSHRSGETLEEHLEVRCPLAASCSVGDMIVFDSTVWHRAGRNVSGSTRYAINLQYSFPWIKQQIDLWRLFASLEELTLTQRRVLGVNSRPPDSFENFYLPPDERFYLAGQG